MKRGAMAAIVVLLANGFAVRNMLMAWEIYFDFFQITSCVAAVE